MSSLPPPRLLIVDDEAPNLKALCESLATRDYAPTGFTSGKAALAALRSQTFDLVLTDLMMPEMDGIALMRAALEIDPRLAGVVMTGQGTIDTAVAAMKLGALDYVLKPFKLSTIVPVLSRALAVRQLRLENEALQQRLRARTLELEAANKELETFSYSASHDLRAPLRAIGHFLEMLVNRLNGQVDAQALVYAGHVRESVIRMNTLIDDLLRLAAMTRAEIHRMPVNLSQLVLDIAAKLPVADGRQVDWIIVPGLIVDGDPGLLSAALENLVSNAFKYTGKVPQARIEVGAETQPDGTLAYYIRDNGAGFNMKYANRLFGAFQRLHTASEFPGTGVGLATVQRIIHKHAGRIWAQAAPGQGATFYFTIPPPTES